MLSKYTLKAYVYVHVQDLKRVELLKEKAIRFASTRNINIIDFCSCNVVDLIQLLIQKKIDVLLINRHALTTNEHRLLISYCHRNSITIVHFEV